MAKIEDLADEKSVLDALYMSAGLGKVCFAGVDTDRTNLNEKTKLFVEKIGRDSAVEWLGRYLTVVSSDKDNCAITAQLSDGIPFKGDCYEIELTKKGKRLLGADLYLKVELLPAKGVIIINGQEKVIDDEYDLVIDFHD